MYYFTFFSNRYRKWTQLHEQLRNIPQMEILSIVQMDLKHCSGVTLIAQKMILKYIIAVSIKKLSFAGATVIKKGSELKCCRENLSFIAPNSIFLYKI